MASSVSIKDYTAKSIKGNSQGAELAILEQAIMVTAQAKALAPVDQGQLRSSIGFITSLAKSGKLSASPKKYEGYVGTPTEYAIYQEFGTRKMSPKPFLRPALGVLSGSAKEIKMILKQNMNEYLRTIRKGDAL